MNDYVATAGQQDILQGTYSPSFINRNAMSLAIAAPGPIESVRIERAIDAMRKQHPVLRMVPVEDESGWRQVILESDITSRQRFIREGVTAESLEGRMNQLVGEMIAEFDIFERPSWGVLQLRSGTTDHIVFVFNHIVADLVAMSQFIRTFVNALTHGDLASAVPDTYTAYLEALENDWLAPASEDSRWWQDRPWSDIPQLPDLHLISGTSRANKVEIVDMVPEHDLLAASLSEGLLVQAVEQSIRDVTGVPITRVDAAKVGRNNHRERFAGGWLSHALPFVTTNANSSRELLEAREKAASWISAFRRVRSRSDLTTANHVRAQVFLNFFGTFAPDKWTYEGFRMSRVQPTYELPGRSSLTPFHLKVRKTEGAWAFEWSLSPQYQETELLKAMSQRTRELLASS